MTGAAHEATASRPTAESGYISSASVAIQSLDAQQALLPYALTFFAIGLPIFVWAASYAADRVWMAASFVVFALNWAAFYAAVDWMKHHPDARSRADLRTRVHVLAGLLWAGAVLQISAMALGAGHAKEPLLVLAAGASAACVFFSAPSLPTLLIVSPVAVVGPLLALSADPETESVGQLSLAGAALAMALSMILNRLLRRLFALAQERERLIEARDRSLETAQALAKSKSDLIATLSHEIHNGLTVVTHVLAAAVGGGRSAPSRDQLVAALGASRDLTAVVNATLDSELAAAGRLRLEQAVYDPGALVRDLVLLHRPQAAAKALELSIHIDEALREAAMGGVRGDPGRARQILNNLIGNAIKYTLRGRIEVRVERAADNRVRIAVADTGPGLGRDDLERAFMPFTRIERTAAGVPGAGLGLSLSRQLAGLMGARLWAESAPGVGSCFHLELPFDDQAVRETRRPNLDPLDDPAATRPLRVMIVEQDPLAAAMLRAILEQLGHDVLAARDGSRAVDLVQPGGVDLIIMGGWTVDADGPAAASAIRALSGPVARTPIIAMISGDAAEARLCRQAGVDQVLRKPVTVGGVARAMAAAFRDEQHQDSRIA